MLDRLVYSRRLVVLEVTDNSLLCIVAVDHRQPQRWNEKFTRSCSISSVIKKHMCQLETTVCVFPLHWSRVLCKSMHAIVLLLRLFKLFSPVMQNARSGRAL